MAWLISQIIRYAIGTAVAWIATDPLSLPHYPHVAVSIGLASFSMVLVDIRIEITKLVEHLNLYRQEEWSRSRKKDGR